MLKSTFSETICESHTYYPGLGDFTLPHTYKYFDWYYPKCELHSKKWVVDNVDSNWNILDVGANVGVYSILFAKLASEGQVFALEPTTTIRLLEKNLKHHKLNNVSIYNIGLSDKSARVEENIFKIWGKPSESSVYEMKRLDEFVNSLNLKRLDLIKIDTDGFELEILASAALTLEKFNPWLMIEFSYALNTRGHEVGHLIERLVSLGYSQAILLDGNNLITRKSCDPLEAWSMSLKIIPHEYSLNTLESEVDLHTHAVVNNGIETLSVSEFLNLFDIRDGSLNTWINPRLPGRGPRMEINDAPILARIYSLLNPKSHLEFGTWEGFGTALFCSNATGLVTTINLPDGERKEGNYSSYPSSYYPTTREKFTGVKFNTPSDSGVSIGWIYKYYGFESRVQQILADSTKLTASDFDSKFNSIFIDGAHDQISVISDTKLAIQLLSENGIIIWHDFTLESGELANFKSTNGVLFAISECLSLFKENGIRLFWIRDSWLLVGIKNWSL